MVHIELPQPYFSVARVPHDINQHMVKVAQGELSKRPGNAFYS